MKKYIIKKNGKYLAMTVPVELNKYLFKWSTIASGAKVFPGEIIAAHFAELTKGRVVRHVKDKP